MTVLYSEDPRLEYIWWMAEATDYPGPQYDVELDPLFSVLFARASLTG